MRLLLLVLALAGARLSAQAWPAPLTEGLRVDLDVTRGVTLDAQGRVAKWTNQAGPAEVREFVGQSQFKLVETMAHRLALLLLERFGMEWIRLSINKPGAVRGSRDVGVSIERRRDALSP